jgi:hypothetical protein
MATPPTFSSGAVLTAAQMNSVGLWLVKTQVVGSGVSSVSVTSAFSGDYNNYKIIYEGGTSSASGGVLFRMQLDGITTQYYSSAMQQTATSGTVVTTNVTAAARWELGYTGNQFMRWEIDLANLNAVGAGKTANVKYACYDTSSSYGGTSAHWLISTAGATAFTLSPASGTISGGTIYVYGYKGTI